MRAQPLALIVVVLVELLPRDLPGKGIGGIPLDFELAGIRERSSDVFHPLGRGEKILAGFPGNLFGEELKLLPDPLFFIREKVEIGPYPDSKEESRNQEPFKIYHSGEPAIRYTWACPNT